MERLVLRYKDALRALHTLGEILQQPFSVIVRDATIQRFEYTFEALWKFLKEYPKEREGIISHSPKACFREIFSLGIINEEETVKFLEMTDRRNDTSHTYKEEVAQIIFSKIPEYFSKMEGFLKKFQGFLS
ncbi:MAG: nucleotidyltransferase [Candidatus Brocadia carolinensis]|uniref:Nucleotidyltransferase n=1 Tax=Candidatus Brocadia carolinensis TaxID=1004156 RepID=A0A1V4AV35_9BACT|nr:MAG: nucleotidyltransferase [Candidatus Brocadia caroliniensis]